MQYESSNSHSNGVNFSSLSHGYDSNISTPLHEIPYNNDGSLSPYSNDFRYSDPRVDYVPYPNGDVREGSPLLSQTLGQELPTVESMVCYSELQMNDTAESLFLHFSRFQGHVKKLAMVRYSHPVNEQHAWIEFHDANAAKRASVGVQGCKLWRSETSIWGHVDSVSMEDYYEQGQTGADWKLERWNDFHARIRKEKSFFYRKFKTELCRNWEAKHECPRGELCWYAHGKEEQRPLIESTNNAKKAIGKYKTQLCKHWGRTGTCPHGGNCTFAHGNVEMRPQTPTSTQRMMTQQRDMFKTRMCRDWQNYGECPRTEQCNFAHGEHELRSMETNRTLDFTTATPVQQVMPQTLFIQAAPMDAHHSQPQFILAQAPTGMQPVTMQSHEHPQAFHITSELPGTYVQNRVDGTQTAVVVVPAASTYRYAAYPAGTIALQPVQTQHADTRTHMHTSPQYPFSPPALQEDGSTPTFVPAHAEWQFYSHPTHA